MIEGNYVQTFLGQCQGVGLTRRGKDDPHVCVVLLVEDDGNWFPTRCPAQGFSSYWVDDLVMQLQAAQLWMTANCDLDTDRHGTAWGWKFRQKARPPKE